MSTGTVTGSETESEVHERHKREKRELHAKIQNLKKSVAVGDKKKRKEIQTKAADWDLELKARHADELSNLLGGVTLNSNSCNGENGANKRDDFGDGRKLSKTQRRRIRKEQQMADKEQRFWSRDIQTKSLNDCENELICDKLQKYSLKIFQIEADGNVFFNQF